VLVFVVLRGVAPFTADCVVVGGTVKLAEDWFAFEAVGEDEGCWSSDCGALLGLGIGVLTLVEILRISFP
jgi:hypothetical protein